MIDSAEEVAHTQGLDSMDQMLVVCTKRLRANILLSGPGQTWLMIDLLQDLKRLAKI